jgi:hypothetical protein
MMRTLFAILVFVAPAFMSADDRIPLDLIAIAEKTRTPAPKVDTPKAAPTKPRRVVQTFRHRVTHGPRPRFWNWEGDPSPSHSFAVQHLRSAHGRHLPTGVDIKLLDMEDLNRIHSHIHNGGKSLGYWEPGPVREDGIQVVVWVWTL